MASDITDRRNGLTTGLAIKPPVKAASTINLVLSGAQTVDGVALVAGDRVLVKNQTSSVNNGIYKVASGTWTRAKDCDGNLDLTQGTIVHVLGGTVSAGLFYECTTTASPIVIGTNNLTWAVVSPSSPITLPLSVAQGGTGGTTAATGAAGLGNIGLTGAAGTANAQTAGAPATFTAFALNQIFEYTPPIGNTGPTTLTVTPSGAGALAAQNVFVRGAALTGGEFVQNVPTILHHDGTRLNIIGPSPVWPITVPKISGGLTWSNNVADATNDIDIAAGSAVDATGAFMMRLSAAITKQLDAAWAVGSGAGGRMSAAAIANTEYAIWLIGRPDTGVIDVGFDVSFTAPTMPANYTYKRLIGWITRAAGAILAFHVYETDGGGVEYSWDVPTLDINLANTLTTARRTDTVRVPTAFSTVVHLNVSVFDAATASVNWICCPDQTDAAPSGSVAPLSNMVSQIGLSAVAQLKVRTSATGTIAARSSLATVDLYAASTIGFAWPRRN